ncbi:MAG TPA: hypothetical protein VMS21_11860 [Methylomirabilota bacterium]|nr:hypothetical protein [Methylomirabilota bacterium]
MSYVTLEVTIEHGRIVPREPERLPETGNGLLTLLPNAGKESSGSGAPDVRRRITLPIIQGDGRQVINPSPEERDASL